jgi:hypothetical protein
MRRSRLLVAVAVMLVSLMACAVKDIEASDYDQSCASGDDCVAVVELEADGTDCSMGCEAQAINKKEKARYDEDLADARRSCGSMSSPFCDVTGTPACVQGRCEMKR